MKIASMPRTKDFVKGSVVATAIKNPTQMFLNKSNMPVKPLMPIRPSIVPPRNPPRPMPPRTPPKYPPRPMPPRQIPSRPVRPVTPKQPKGMVGDAIQQARKIAGGYW